MSPSYALLLGAMLCTASVSTASAATLCVNSNGAMGCYTRISDAVAAAAPGDAIYVGPGTYNESVTVNKGVSLIADRAVIDATGLTRGIFVNGLFNLGLDPVHISGFTIKGANLEGILILNSSRVTISNNTVIENNKALLPNGTCPSKPSFEPGEDQDCGEGIHLQAVDHSIVTNNTVSANSGGILLSDDTGATHDNLISENTVRDNPYACGVTMASHLQAPESASPIPQGVFHNTIYRNRISRSGLANGGGSGVGIFASVPGTKAYGNVVVNNLLTENGLPGVALHAHAPNQILADNMIVGNTISNNGADYNDAHTPGPTGINIYSLTPATGNIVAENIIQSESYDVGINVPAVVQVQFNMLLGLNTGVINLGAGTIDATNNFWGCGTGPATPGSCSNTLGQGIFSTPWLTAPIPAQTSF